MPSASCWPASNGTARSPSTCSTSVGTPTDGSTSRMSIGMKVSISARAMRGLAAARAEDPRPALLRLVMVMLGAKISMSWLASPQFSSRFEHLDRGADGTRERSQWRSPQAQRSARRKRAAEESAMLSRCGRIAASNTEVGPPSEIPKSSGPLRARGIEDGLDVGHALLEGGQLQDRIRQTCARLVVDDEPRERGQAGQQARDLGFAHCRSRWETKPGETSRSTGPSPTT